MTVRTCATCQHMHDPPLPDGSVANDILCHRPWGQPPKTCHAERTSHSFGGGLGNMACGREGRWWEPRVAPEPLLAPAVEPAASPPGMESANAMIRSVTEGAPYTPIDAPAPAS